MTELDTAEEIEKINKKLLKIDEFYGHRVDKLDEKVEELQGALATLATRLQSLERRK